MKQTTLFEQPEKKEQKGVRWPCDEALKHPVGSKERLTHIKNCKVCAALLTDLEKSIGLRN
jgi:hypothetical protein